MRRCARVVVAAAAAPPASSSGGGGIATTRLPMTCTAATRTSVRHFVGVGGFIGSVLGAVGCMVAFACIANNYSNVRKFGWWRFGNVGNFSNVAHDFRRSRYVGGAFGLLFWWTVVAPRKYINSDQAFFPDNVRFGPL